MHPPPPPNVTILVRSSLRKRLLSLASIIPPCLKRIYVIIYCLSMFLMSSCRTHVYTWSDNKTQTCWIGVVLLNYCFRQGLKRHDSFGRLSCSGWTNEYNVFSRYPGKCRIRKVISVITFGFLWILKKIHQRLPKRFWKLMMMDVCPISQNKVGDESDPFLNSGRGTNGNGGNPEQPHWKENDIQKCFEQEKELMPKWLTLFAHIECINYVTDSVSLFFVNLYTTNIYNSSTFFVTICILH